MRKPYLLLYSIVENNNDITRKKKKNYFEIVAFEILGKKICIVDFLSTILIFFFGLFYLLFNILSDFNSYINPFNFALRIGSLLHNFFKTPLTKCGQFFAAEYYREFHSFNSNKSRNFDSEKMMRPPMV